MQAEAKRRLEQKPQELSTLSMLLPHPASGETDGMLRPSALAARVVQSRLRGEGHGVDAVVPTQFPVPRNGVDIAGEHDVELLGSIDKEIEIRRIFLVPEDGADAVLTAVSEQVAQRVEFPRQVMGDHITPRAIISAPRRLDQQKRGPHARYFSLPIPGR